MAALPEWMEKAVQNMAARTDASVTKPTLEGDVNASSIRELYRKMTAKDMHMWILTRYGRENEKGNTKPNKETVFKQMYPILFQWMKQRGHCLKESNVTAKKHAMKALVQSIQVY